MKRGVSKGEGNGDTTCINHNLERGAVSVDLVKQTTHVGRVVVGDIVGVGATYETLKDGKIERHR